MSYANVIDYKPVTHMHNCERCQKEMVEAVEYCDECHAYYYCECGASLGEYAGEGFCKRCE